MYYQTTPPCIFRSRPVDRTAVPRRPVCKSVLRTVTMFARGFSGLSAAGVSTNQQPSVMNIFKRQGLSHLGNLGTWRCLHSVQETRRYDYTVNKHYCYIDMELRSGSIRRSKSVDAMGGGCKFKEEDKHCEYSVRVKMRVDRRFWISCGVEAIREKKARERCGRKRKRNN